MSSMDLTYDEFVMTKCPNGEPDVIATLQLEVEYEWEPYNPGRWEDEPPSGGGPEGWEIKVKSAKLMNYDGCEAVATPESLARLQKMVSEDKAIDEWVGTQLQENHQEPERDYDDQGD